MDDFRLVHLETTMLVYADIPTSLTALFELADSFPGDENKHRLLPLFKTHSWS